MARKPAKAHAVRADQVDDNGRLVYAEIRITLRPKARTLAEYERATRK